MVIGHSNALRFCLIVFEILADKLFHHNGLLFANFL
jgi:hypothetical protein